MAAANIRSVLPAIHFAAPHLLEGGRIITIASDTADRIGSAGSSVCAMTRAAVAQLVRAAPDFAPRHITVNNIQPGPIETDIPASLVDYIVARLPLGRIGKADEVARFRRLAGWLRRGYDRCKANDRWRLDRLRPA